MENTTTPALPVTDPLDVAADWRARGHRVAVATVVQIWGSAPVPVGSHMVIDDAGRFAGSVSGGCIEGAVVEAAAGVIANDTPRELKFGVTDKRAWEVGLSCGGEVKIFLEPVR